MTVLRHDRLEFSSVNSGVISGTVTSASGGPASGCRVTAVEPQSYIIHGRTETGANGTYSISHLNKALRYHVIFEDYDGGTQYDFLIRSRVVPG